MGLGHALRRLFWLHHFFLLGGLARALSCRQDSLVHRDHVAWQYCHVALRLNPTVYNETRRFDFRSVPSEGRMKNGFLYRRLAQPLLDLLRQGVTPEKLALSIALGAVFGIFPALGWTTALCALIAFLWRLNLPAIQIVNYFMYPVQIAFLLPFFRLGKNSFAPRIFRSLFRRFTPWPRPIFGVPSNFSGALPGTPSLFGR